VATTTTNAYDANGSLTTSTTGADTTVYTYDVRNKLATVATDGTTTATYVYDDAGNRVQETAGGITTFYLTDNANPTGYAQPLEEWTTTSGSLSSATLSRTYLIGPRVFGQADSSGNVNYLLTDAHGSTQQITDESGNITSSLRYTAFGTAVNFDPGSVATEYLFGGDAVYDPPSGLYLHGDGTRDVLGFEFIQADDQGNGTTSDPISLYEYLYASGDPIDGSDPSGHDDLAELALTEGLGEDLDANVDEGDVKATEKATEPLLTFNVYLAAKFLGQVLPPWHTQIDIFASSAESVGEFRLGQAAELVI
jgi:YD repeat-containing protein